MMTKQTLLASRWIQGASARRPMRPSEARLAGSTTRRRLPWARAEMGQPRPVLPWEHRTANDWRGAGPA